MNVKGEKIENKWNYLIIFLSQRFFFMQYHYKKISFINYFYLLAQKIKYYKKKLPLSFHLQIVFSMKPMSQINFIFIGVNIY